MRRPLLLALTALTVAAAPLAAQDASCAAKGPKLPAAGGWAEYQTDSGSIRIAYLGHETAGERIEMSMTRPPRGNRPGGPMVMQVVVPGFPYEMSDAQEVVMQMGDQPPMKMGAQMLGMMRGRMPNASQINAEQCARLTKVGEESVTVPAGTFRTTHWRDAERNTDVWVAQNVPFGMVKVVNEGRTVVLAGQGTGATSKITGTPMEMGPGMMGPPGGRPPRNQ